MGTGVPMPGEILVQWISTDLQFDVPAFGALSGFSITSATGPNNVAFSLLDENFDELAGQTVGPGPILFSAAEPSTLLLFGIAFVGFWITRRATVTAEHSSRPITR